MGFKSANIFVNLPVKDLNKSVEFFTELGFEFNAQFTDENATCMVIGDNIFAMLLVEDYFKSFILKDIADTKTTSEVILALSAENREQVVELVNKAHAAGATHSKEAVDHGFMYQWGFQDLDGHLWEVFYMDRNAVNPTE